MTKDPRNVNRRVMFDEAGKGVYLLLRNSGLRVLSSTYGENHLQVVERAFLFVDIPVIEKLLDLMVWKDEAKHEVSLEDFDDFPMEFLVDKLRDAWSLSLNGRTYMEQVEFVRREASKGADSDPLPTSPVDSSEASSEQPSGQA